MVNTFIIYGLLPIDLFPKLTEETKVIWTYLLLADKMMKVEQQTTAGSVRENVQSCLHNNTWLQYYWIPELVETIAGFSKEGGAGPLHNIKL